MTGMLVCLSAAVMGVDYGWQPVAGGGIEYIIQIEPELLDSLKSGHDLFSDLPTSVRNIRSYRITVGTGRLPHHGEPPPSSAVVPAGGSTKKRTRASDVARDVGPADIDLSQLPGPVLGPALVSGKPGGDGSDEEEPPHLAAASDAEPIKSRVAGYREKHDRASENATAPLPNAEKIGEKAEPESPSDGRPTRSDVATTKPALVQLGLFTSICCNVFLLWVATGQRSRYRALVRRMFEGAGNASMASLASIRDVDLPKWERLPAPDKDDIPGTSDSAGN